MKNNINISEELINEINSYKSGILWAIDSNSNSDTFYFAIKLDNKSIIKKNPSVEFSIKNILININEEEVIVSIVGFKFEDFNTAAFFMSENDLDIYKKFLKAPFCNILIFNDSNISEFYFEKLNIVNIVDINQKINSDSYLKIVKELEFIGGENLSKLVFNSDIKNFTVFKFNE